MNAPIAVTSAAASVYQVATNSGESSVQCEAYSVAASPADTRPAKAPATAGRVGAPGGEEGGPPASSGNDSSGMALMQIIELDPTNRVIVGNRCGIIISPAIP